MLTARADADGDGVAASNSNGAAVAAAATGDSIGRGEAETTGAGVVFAAAPAVVGEGVPAFRTVAAMVGTGVTGSLGPRVPTSKSGAGEGKGVVAAAEGAGVCSSSGAGAAESVGAGVAEANGEGVEQPQVIANVDAKSPQSQVVTSEGWVAAALVPAASKQRRSTTSRLSSYRPIANTYCVWPQA